MNPTPLPRPPVYRPPTVLNMRRIACVVLGVALLIAGGVAWVLRTQIRPVAAAVAEASNWPSWMRQPQAYAVPEPPTPPVKDVAHDKTAEELAAMKAMMARQQQELDVLKKRPVATPAAPPPPPAVKKGSPSMLFVDYTPKEGSEGKKKGEREYTIMPGYFLPCQIQTAMNSDTGDVTFVAVTTTTVYDTATGRIPLIAQGSKIVGDAQGSTLIYGNELMKTVSLTLSRRGDTKPIDLGHAPVTDQRGVNGLASSVDNHFWKLVGAVFIGGTLRGGQQAIQTSVAEAGGVGQVARGISAVGSQAGQQRIGRALDTRPTIRVDAGQLCNILLVKPLQLSAIYE